MLAKQDVVDWRTMLVMILTMLNVHFSTTDQSILVLLLPRRRTPFPNNPLFIPMPIILFHLPLDASTIAIYKCCYINQSQF
ncbi:hypothetical protein BDV36DRAFT_140235 [Aspergillus pseudocaelatus]|uniref:Uncharacterized protein n=1 Tax=Aspergillus pseudocaelatus TaxID=1825620 RepID=A0ABQ6WRX2_9EURO|nr:hypothetical protein BDV36DRAFT_140235 [Aspergillus pseudocaelatus]